jgi:hypothetical protein
MDEEIQEIDRLTKQTGELADSLIQYVRKLQERSQLLLDSNQDRTERFAALLEKLIDLGACSAVLSQEMQKERLRQQRQAHVKARMGATDGSGTPPEAVIELLRVSVADKTTSPESAADELTKLLRPDLQASRKIEIRKKAKAAFEAGDDVVSKVRPFLRNSQREAEHIRNSTKPVISQRM